MQCLNSSVGAVIYIYGEKNPLEAMGPHTSNLLPVLQPVSVVRVWGLDDITSVTTKSNPHGVTPSLCPTKILLKLNRAHELACQRWEVMFS